MRERLGGREPAVRRRRSRSKNASETSYAESGTPSSAATVTVEPLAMVLDDLAGAARRVEDRLLVARRMRSAARALDPLQRLEVVAERVGP